MDKQSISGKILSLICVRGSRALQNLVTHASYSEKVLGYPVEESDMFQAIQ